MNKNFREIIIRVLEDIGEGKAIKNNRYSVSEEGFSSILDYINSKDLARGINVVRKTVDNQKIPGFMNPYLTSRGIAYLNKNI